MGNSGEKLMHSDIICKSIHNSNKQTVSGSCGSYICTSPQNTNKQVFSGSCGDYSKNSHTSSANDSMGAGEQDSFHQNQEWKKYSVQNHNAFVTRNECNNCPDIV